MGLSTGCESARSLMRIGETISAKRRKWVCTSANYWRHLAIGAEPPMFVRHLTPRVEEASGDTCRRCAGGATGRDEHTRRRGRTSSWGVGRVPLDDEPVRRAAITDPVGFLDSSEELLVIDEVQRVPEPLLAIKHPSIGRRAARGIRNVRER
jgi:hypothetical protein